MLYLASSGATYALSHLPSFHAVGLTIGLGSGEADFDEINVRELRKSERIAKTSITQIGKG